MSRKKWSRKLAATALFVCIGSGVFAQEQPQRGGTLVFAVSLGEPVNYDCHAANSLSSMYRLAPHYSTLLQIDPRDFTRVMGDVAQSWSISADGLIYTFKLNEARFHDGSALTSSDVRVSLERMRNPPPGVASVRQELYKDVESMEVPDLHTLVIRLSKPDTAMLVKLAQPYGCIYSEKMLREDPAYPTKKVMGSGPFVFVRHIPGSEWIGERFKSYFHAGLPYLDGFKALSMTPAATVNALAAGQVMTDFRGVSRVEAERIVAARGDGVKLFESNPAIATHFLASINTQRPALSDPRVRRALALAVDHWAGAKAMERSSTLSVVGALTRPGSAFAPSESELMRLPGFSRDIEAARKEARKLLAEAGHTDLKLTFLNRKPWPFLGVFLIDQLRQIGVTLTQDIPEDPQFFARRKAGDYDLIVGVLPDYLDDPSVTWSIFTSFDRNKANWSRYSDSKVDALMDRQSRLDDPKERLRVIRELEEYLLSQGYVLPFFWGRRTTVIDSSLKGYVSAPTNYVGQDLAHYWLKH